MHARAPPTARSPESWPSVRVARDSDALTVGPSDITFYDGEEEGAPAGILVSV